MGVSECNELMNEWSVYDLLFKIFSECPDLVK